MAGGGLVEGVGGGVQGGGVRARGVWVRVVCKVWKGHCSPLQSP